MTEPIAFEETIIPSQAVKIFPGIWTSFGWIILFFIIQIASTMAAIMVATYLRTSPVKDIGALDSARILSDSGGLPIIWGLVASSVLTLLLLWLYLRKHNRIAAIHCERWSQIPLKNTVIMAIILIGGAIGLNYLYATYIIPDIKLQDQLRQLFESIPKTPVNITALFVTVAILAPLTEELLFRGLLQKSLSHRLPQYGAIILSALIFAAIHFDLYAFPVLFVMGAVFGYIYYRTGSLRVTILLHMINNAAALLIN